MRLNFDRAVFFIDTYQSIVLIAFQLAEIGNFYMYKLGSNPNDTIIAYKSNSSILFLGHILKRRKSKR